MPSPEATHDPAFERRCLLLALALIILAAWRSLGFYHYDEHFQLLEYAANVKRGITPTTDVPWEYQNRIRPWFQPAIALATLNLFERLGDRNPFDAAAFLRLLSGLLSWIALVRLVRCSRAWFHSQEIRRIAVASACFLWFMPFLAVRFSSEGWAGALFVLGFTSLVELAQGSRIAPFELVLSGFLMGWGFAARYQVGIMIGAALAWLVWTARPRRADLLALGTGLTLSLAGGLIVDRWGYGTWVFTPWRYLDFQVLQGVAARRFGVAPWWTYVSKVFLIAGPPIGLLLLVGGVSAWIRRPRSALTWVTLPFFLAHTLLGHKELRFLFPIALLTPFLAAQGIEALPPGVLKALSSRAARPFWALLVGLDLAACLLRTVIPARHEVAIEQAIYDNDVRQLYIVEGRDPYIVGDLRITFYRDPRLQLTDLGTPNRTLLGLALRTPATLAWPAAAGFDPAELRCQVLYRSLPAWTRQGWSGRALRWANPNPWTLARCVVDAAPSLTLSASSAAALRRGGVPAPDGGR